MEHDCVRVEEGDDELKGEEVDTIDVVSVRDDATAAVFDDADKEEAAAAFLDSDFRPSMAAASSAVFDPISPSS